MKIAKAGLSDDFCFIMKGLGITTVLQAYNFLYRCSPNLKIQNTRVTHLRTELNNLPKIEL